MSFCNANLKAIFETGKLFFKKVEKFFGERGCYALRDRRELRSEQPLDWLKSRSHPHKTFLRNVKTTIYTLFYPQNLPLGDGASSTVPTDLYQQRRTTRPKGLYAVATVGTTIGLAATPQRYHSLQILGSTFDPAGVGGWPLLAVLLFTLHPAGVKAETHSICNC
jgi:hypothetical protein